MMHAAANEVALLTPPGTGAIAVLRVTGFDAERIGAKLLRLRRRGDVPPRGNELRLGDVLDGGETIDEAVVRGLAAGSVDGLELCVHGGVRVAQRILEAAERLGARVVEEPGAAGTWSARNAVEADALDLLPQVRTVRAVRYLLAQRQVLPRAVQELRQRVAPDVAVTHLTTWLERGRAARKLIHGACVAIVGPPNAGKSQLFNALVGREASIVSPRRGTTRDWVTAEVEIDGTIVRLMDTAGRHTSDDPLEQAAIDRTHLALERVDLSILVVERGEVGSLDAWGEFVPPGAMADDTVKVCNKWDDPAVIASEPVAHPIIRISALRGHGLDTVREAILGRLGVGRLDVSLPCLFCERQVRAGERARDAFRRGDAKAWEALLSIVEPGPA